MNGIARLEKERYYMKFGSDNAWQGHILHEHHNHKALLKNGLA